MLFRDFLRNIISVSTDHLTSHTFIIRWNQPISRTDQKVSSMNVSSINEQQAPPLSRDSQHLRVKHQDLGGAARDCSLRIVKRSNFYELLHRWRSWPQKRHRNSIAILSDHAIRSQKKKTCFRSNNDPRIASSLLLLHNLVFYSLNLFCLYIFLTVYR